MKRKMSMILAICAAAVFSFAGCAEQGEGSPTNSIQTAAQTADVKTQAPAATQKAETVAPTATPEPADDGKEKAADNVYTISFDMAILQGSAGFIFNGLENNFLMWQLNTSENGDGRLYFRPHIWEGGNARCIEEVPIDAAVATGAAGESMHMEIQMDNGQCKTFLNGTLIYTYEVEEYEYDDLCNIGFRTDVFQAGEIFEYGWFDNIVVTNSLGEVILQENFEGETNYFSETIDDYEYDCQVKDGKLVVGRNERVLLMTELPPLNP